MNDPLAYLLTWTCYGTWLHGDPRGSVAPGANVPDTETLAPNNARRQFEANRMNAPALELGHGARHIVEGTLTDHCAMRRWKLLASAVRTSHVHVVVGHADVRPEKIMAEFKAWSTHRLRAAGYVCGDQRVWTRHGSTRYLWNERSVNAAIAYVQEGQDVPR